MIKPDKTCPKCESSDYRFRARKNLDDGTETTYLCVSCGKKWKVKTELVTLVRAEEVLWAVDASENLS